MALMWSNLVMHVKIDLFFYLYKMNIKSDECNNLLAIIKNIQNIDDIHDDIIIIIDQFIDPEFILDKEILNRIFNILKPLKEIVVRVKFIECEKCNNIKRNDPYNDYCENCVIFQLSKYESQLNTIQYLDYLINEYTFENKIMAINTNYMEKIYDMYVLFNHSTYKKIKRKISVDLYMGSLQFNNLIQTLLIKERCSAADLNEGILLFVKTTKEYPYMPFPGEIIFRNLSYTADNIIRKKN
jgi:hypothetical protein